MARRINQSDDPAERMPEARPAARWRGRHRNRARRPAQSSKLQSEGSPHSDRPCPGRSRVDDLRRAGEPREVGLEVGVVEASGPPWSRMTVGRSCIVAPSGTSAGPSTSNHRRLPFTSTCIGAPEASGTFRAMRRALVLGGTGAIGRATARRLLAAGWQVELTGRDPSRFPDDIAAAGGRFVSSERGDEAQLAAAFGGGADLLVDCVCFTAKDAARLLPLAREAELDRDDLEQGGVRRSRRQPLQLGDEAALRRPNFRDAADDGARERRLHEPRGLRREQGRGRAGPARQRLPRDRAQAVEDPRAGLALAARVGLREARARRAPRGLPRPSWRGRRPHDRGREHRGADRGRGGVAGRAGPEQRRPGCAERPRDRAHDRAAARPHVG